MRKANNVTRLARIYRRHMSVSETTPSEIRQNQLLIKFKRTILKKQKKMYEIAMMCSRTFSFTLDKSYTTWYAYTENST